MLYGLDERRDVGWLMLGTLVNQTPPDDSRYRAGKVNSGWMWMWMLRCMYGVFIAAGADELGGC